MGLKLLKSGMVAQSGMQVRSGKASLNQNPFKNFDLISLLLKLRKIILRSLECITKIFLRKVVALVAFFVFCLPTRPILNPSYEWQM